MYINCLDDAVKAGNGDILVSKFADDSKIGSAIHCPEDAERLQRAIDNLSSWCERWGMEVHPEKSAVLHFGFNNQHANYKIKDTNIAAVEGACDLGVHIANMCDSSEHVSNIAKKAHAVLSQLRRATTLRDSTFVRLYSVVGSGRSCMEPNKERGCSHPRKGAATGVADGHTPGKEVIRRKSHFIGHPIARRQMPPRRPNPVP